MNKGLCIILFFLITPGPLWSQVFPKEGSTLNYRLIGFSFPPVEKMKNCRLEIALGNYNNEDLFKKNVITSIDIKDHKIIAEVPSFGKQYTWRVTHAAKKVASTFYHFSTGMAAGVDTSITHLRIIKRAESYSGSYFFIDYLNVLYDMEGNPVWYLPDKNEFAAENNDLRDIKITSAGTITFLSTYNAYEIAWDGTILWKAPNDGRVSGDSIEHYHHEFTRLANGHYMVMGLEKQPVYIKTSDPQNGIDSSLFIGYINKTTPEYKEMPNSSSFGTIIEYNEKGNVVWSYKAATYFSGSDLINRRGPDGSLNLAMHDNGFYLDETDSILYISFKDISRVIKVKYPEGYTMNTYGKAFKKYTVLGEDMERNLPVGLRTGNGLFCGQHCCRRSQKGYLYLFNNDGCHPGALPKIIMMQQPAPYVDSLKKIWEYECELENEDKKLRDKIMFSKGGNVEELPGGSFFASMGGGYSKLFIVSLNKKILWSAMAEKWNAEEKKWRQISVYRASIITDRKKLEQLIWNSEK